MKNNYIFKSLFNFYIFGVFIILVTTAFSCRKSPLTNGDITKVVRMLSQFDTIYLHDNIDVRLIKSDTFKVEITTCENLMDNIITDIEGSILTVRNENGLNWIRDYDYELRADIYYKSHISKIHYGGVNSLTSEGFISDDTISSFDLIIDEGGGDINLSLYCKKLHLKNSGGSTKVVLKGHCENASIRHSALGPIHIDDFPTDTITAVNIGNNHIYLNCVDTLKSSIYSYGNTYYKGHPKISSYVSPNALGRLIEIENLKN